MNNLLVRLALGGVMAVGALAQEFNFDSGQDTGLTRYDPLSAFGMGGSFSFPGGNTYRIQATSTAPISNVAGPGRAGAYLGVSYDTFVASVDLVAWNEGLAQGVGLLGRAQDIGLGSSDGYAFFYFPAFASVAINRIDNEAATVLASPENPLVSLNPSLDYRLVFSGSGSSLKGEVFALSDLSTPLVSVTATDPTYAAGFTGLLVAGTVADPTSPGDATFDNFKAIPEPSTVGLALLGGGVLVAGSWLRRRK